MKTIYHNVETNGIGYVTLLFDLSAVKEEDLPYVGILQNVSSALSIQRITSMESCLMRSISIQAESERRLNYMQMRRK